MMANTQQQERHVATDEMGERIQRLLLEFLENFRRVETERSTGQASPTTGAAERAADYVSQARKLLALDTTILFIDFSDVLSYNEHLANIIQEDFYRFEPYIRAAVQTFVKKCAEDGIETEKEFLFSFYNLPLTLRIRDLRTDKIGRLECICGTVTRTSEVRPELLFGMFRCLECGAMSDLVEQQFKFTQPLMCYNSVCNNRTRWELMVERSKFVDFQKVRVQENAAEIPSGTMPRSIDVILRNEVVETVKPGDKSFFTGTLIVVPDVSQMGAPGERAQIVTRETSASNAGYAPAQGATGLRALGVRELTYRLIFLANHASVLDSTTSGIEGGEEKTLDEDFTQEQQAEVLDMNHTDDLYGKLVASITPAVHGHEEVKRGVLLMLFGGVHKETVEGMQLRGDVNVCVVGDPSTAKSQFLKYVVSFLPRAIYTSGKGSSAAGLTATVVKDPETGEFAIEAGALMLADNGICCIDEFDKMDARDQVAIHEAMEQQTISIAKAGIQATLNARTSILAAANPIGGRYDKSKSLKANLGISPAIMSRFDLFFIVEDECNRIVDYNIARHLLTLHQLGDSAIRPPFSSEQLRLYLRFARRIRPIFSSESAKLVVERYRTLRQQDFLDAGQTAFRFTVRQLESMVRLSEALAKLHLDSEVKPQYVREAARLIQKSNVQVVGADVDIWEGEEPSISKPVEEAPGRPEVESQLKEVREKLSVELDHVQDLEKEIAELKDELLVALDNHIEEVQSTLEEKQLLLRQHNEEVATLTERMLKLQQDGEDVGDGEGEGQPAEAHHQPRKSKAISFEEYRQVSRKIVAKLRALDGDGDAGMKISELCKWYLEELDISSNEQLKEEEWTIRSVIRRLIGRDFILVVLNESERQAALAAYDQGKAEGKDVGEEPDMPEEIVAVHPNFSE